MPRVAGRAGGAYRPLPPGDWERPDPRSSREEQAAGRVPRLFLLTVVVALVIWLAFLLAAALSSVQLKLVNDVGAAEAATLVSGTSVCTTSPSADHDFTHSARSWAVIGVSSRASTADPSLCLYHDAGHTQLLCCSQLAGSGTVDFVVQDFHTPSVLGTYYVHAQRDAGSGNWCTEYDAGATTLVGADSTALTVWDANDICQSYNLVLTGGVAYRIRVGVLGGALDAGIALFDSQGQADYCAARDAAILQADRNGAGVSEGFLFKPAATDTFGLVLWANPNSGNSNYRIEVSRETELQPGAITTTGVKDYYFVPSQPQSWAVLLLRPVPQTDEDLRLFDGADYRTLLKASNVEEGLVDMIVGQYANTSQDTAFARTISFGPEGLYILDLEDGMPFLSPGTPGEINLTGQVAQSYRLELTGGVPYTFTFDPTGSTTDASSMLFGPAPNFVYGTRVDSVAGSDFWAQSGEPEVFMFTPPATDEYLWLVYGKVGSPAGTALYEGPCCAVGVDPEPSGFGLALPSPQPTRAGRATRISFALHRAGRAALRVYDSRGTWVRDLVDAALDPGPQVVFWDGRDAAGSLVRAGIYYLRLDFEGLSRSRRLVFLP